MEVIQEVFREIQNESPLKKIDINLSTHKPIVIRRKVRGVIVLPYSRTTMKRNSLANTMIRAYNFLVDLDLISDDLVNLIKNEVRFVSRMFYQSISWTIGMLC